MRTWLTEMRKEKNLTMREIGGQVGVSESYYSMIEAGSRKPSVAIAKRIADLLSFDWTMFYEEPVAS